MANYELSDRVLELEAKVDAILRISELSTRASLDGTELVPLTYIDGSDPSGYSEGKILLTDLYKKRYKEKTADYELVADDKNYIITMRGDDLTLTIPDDLGFVLGEDVVIEAYGTGLIIAKGSGVTLNQPQTFQDVEYSVYQFRKTDINEFRGVQYGVSVSGGGAVDSVNGQTGVVVLDADDIDDASTTHKFATEAQLTKVDSVETGATADQTDAEIETAYNNQVGIVSEVDAKAGTSTTAERWTPERVAQAIVAKTEPLNDLTFSGEFDVSTKRDRYYNDLSSGTLGELSLSSTKTLGALCTVRLSGAVSFSIPSNWHFSGDTISTDPYKFNELTMLYVAENDIRMVCRVYDNDVDFTPEFINDEYLWHKFDTDTTTTSTSGSDELIESSSDSLDTSSYSISPTSSKPKLVTELSKEAVLFSGSNGLKIDSTSFGNTAFRDSFYIFFQVKMVDGQPAATKYFFNQRAGTTDRIWLDVRTDGKITFAYTVDSNNCFAQSDASVFSDGADSDYKDITINVVNGDNVYMYVDNVLVALNGTFDGDMSGVTMANYDSLTNPLYIGVYSSGNDQGINGYMRNLVVQPGTTTEGQRTSLATL